VTLAWSGSVTLVLLKVIGFFLPLRVREEHERIGLDVSLHGEPLQWQAPSGVSAESFKADSLPII